MSRGFIDKYFTNHETYPNICGDILPLGTLYEYISSTFVNGFLNYAKPIKAYMINKYEDNPTVNLKSVQGFNNNKDIHKDFSSLTDDVLILSKSEFGEYFFFWLDKDVSDCCVGRFKTEDTEEMVKYAFELYVKERNDDIRPKNIDASKPFQLFFDRKPGWMSF